jgi:hypothetical protein
MTAKSAHQRKAAPRKAPSGHLLLRFRSADTVVGVSRRTAARLAKTLCLTETQTIHLALARLAQTTLPRYEPDEGALTASELRAIRKLEPQGRFVPRESLFE